MSQKTSQRQPHRDPGGNYTFRRSRTLTGSLHSEVRAASELNSQLRSPRLKHHDLRAHRRRLSSVLLIIIAVSGLLAYVIFSYSHDIERVRVTNAPSAPQSELQSYREASQKYLDQNPFERFRFLFNKQRFTQFLQSDAPEVVSATTDETERFMTSEVVLQLRQPVAVWSSNSERYYVSSDGIAFKKTVMPMPAVTVVDKSANTDLSSAAASTKMLRFIGRVVALVNASGVGTVASVELPASSTRQVDVRLVGKPYSIKTHLDRDPASQAADIVRAVQYFSAKDITPQYIDVRVSSKAFYQ